VTGGIKELRLENFRCFPSATLAQTGAVNVIVGNNASGKTSLLEAIYFLGRGLSFRAARPGPMIRYGASEAVVFGLVSQGAREHRVGLQAAASNVEIRVDGQTRASRADLADVLAVQLLDPQAHELIQGAPEGRRRFLDWGVFHVEHSFLPDWQRYRRALQQRNAALRQGERIAALAWDEQLLDSAARVDQARQSFLAAFEPWVQESAARLLGHPVTLDYWPGWARSGSLAEALTRNLDSDLAMGTTSSGPHRADLRISVDERKARDAVSRGQEKLLVAALTVAQGQVVAAARGEPAVLLIDEPAADLDRQHLSLLIAELEQCGAQLFVTCLEQNALPLGQVSRMFHVEHGEVTVLL